MYNDHLKYVSKYVKRHPYLKFITSIPEYQDKEKERPVVETNFPAFLSQAMQHIRLLLKHYKHLSDEDKKQFKDFKLHFCYSSGKTFVSATLDELV